MKAISAKATRGLNIGSVVLASDNSGAQIVKIVSVKKGKTTRKRQQAAKISDWVKVSVRVGKPEMKGMVFDAVVIRQRKYISEGLGEYFRKLGLMNLHCEVALEEAKDGNVTDANSRLAIAANELG